MLNKSILKRAAQQAIKLTGNVSTSISYYDVSQASYDATTGVIIASETTVKVRVLFTTYSQREQEHTEINKTDMKVVIACKDVSFIPSIGDKLKKTDGSFWVIKNKEQDFAECFWFLQVRPI